MNRLQKKADEMLRVAAENGNELRTHRRNRTEREKQEEVPNWKLKN